MPEDHEQPLKREPLARPSTLLSGRARAATVMVMIAGALAYFAFAAFSGATVRYMSIAQAAALEPTPPDRSVGIIGKLVPDSYIRSADGLTAYFQLRDEDGSQHLPVSYPRGEVGQVFFNEHSEIILQGRIIGEGVFVASDLQVRCPSKYMTEQEKAELEAMNDGQPLPPPYQPDYFDAGA